MTKHFFSLFALLIAHYSLSIAQQYTPQRVVDDPTRRELSTDANTALLLHMNETSGSTVADTSGNLTALTIVFDFQTRNA